MRIWWLGIVAFLPAWAFAASSIHPHGAMLTNGFNAVPGSLSSVTHNPAAGSLVLRDGERMRFGYWSSLGGSLEFGEVKNFEQELEDLVDLVEQNNISSQQQAEQQLNRANEVLKLLADDGYLMTRGGIAVPGFPMVIRGLGKLSGVFSLDLAIEGQAGLTVLADEIEIFSPETGQFAYQTNSSAYLKSAMETRGSFGYSQKVWGHDQGVVKGSLVAGMRLSVYKMSLSKQVIGFNALEDEEISDVISDQYDTNQRDTTALGIDAGLMWVGDRYHLGFTVMNIGEPSFDFGAVGTDCSDLPDGTAQDNCFLAFFFAAGNQENVPLIERNETHKKNVLGTVDASFLISPNWMISGAWDLAESHDPVGGVYQWATASITYYPGSYWVPAWRLGYRSNQSGSELSTVNVGTTLLGVFNIDLSYGMDTTTVEGDEYPRTFGINIGFEEKF